MIESMESNVEYRKIPGAAGYLVGTDGSVWSQLSTGPRGNRKLKPWRRMNASKFTEGQENEYLKIDIHYADRTRCTRVHSIVLEAFVGSCPKGKQGCHNDGIKYHNWISNLRWDTPKKNAADKVKHGTHLVGENHPLSKIPENLRTIAIAANRRGQIPRIAKLFGVNSASLHSVRHRYKMKANI